MKKCNMRIVFKSILAAIVFSLLLVTSVFAYDWHELPDGNCMRFVAEEFSKVAPSPGVNWLDGKNVSTVERAKQAGWVVKTNPSDAMVGAMAEWRNSAESRGHVAIVRAVLADRIIIEETNTGKFVGTRDYMVGGGVFKANIYEGWGRPNLRSIGYSEFSTADSSLSFCGYVWPVRQSDYDKEPASYRVIPSREPTYKGFREYWAPACILKEFDKVAPKPGANWQGNLWTWVDSAKESGWVVKRDVSDAMVGALVLRGNRTASAVKAGIVREVKTDSITIELRANNLYTYTETLQFNELKLDKKGYAFIGYIWPVRAR